MKGELLKGHLDLLLLATVRARPAHGYDIIQELRRRSQGAFDLAEGTVYPALHRLEEGGLLSSKWTTYSGRKRRIYEITRKGTTALGEQEADWHMFSKAMRAVLEST